MPRLIAIFLLMLLPLQSIWAASEPYCQHEQDQTAQHVGHHVDAHHGDDNTSSKAPSLADHDPHCCGALSLPSAVMPLSAALPAEELVAAPMAIDLSFDASRIERPNWPISR